MLHLEKVSYFYDTGTGKIEALKDVTLTFYENDFTVIMGSTGSGKSTLLQLLSGIIQPNSGSIYYQNKKIVKAEYNTLRRNIGLLFQFPEHQLFAETVEDDIAFAPKNQGLESFEIKRRVRDSLELVGLSYEKYAKRSPFSLSGGEQRKVALAGILSLKPEILLLDEPTSGLDANSKRELIGLLCDLNRNSGTTIIMATHDTEQVLEVMKRIVILKDGEVAIAGTPLEAFTNGDLLHEAGLKPPGGQIIIRELGERGFNVSRDVYKPDDVVAEILTLFPGRLRN